MRDRAIVVQIIHPTKKILVRPLLTDTCISCANASSCSSNCAKTGESFPVSNPNNFLLKIGSIVNVTAKIKYQAIQSVISLFFPILSGLGGYFITNYITQSSGKPHSEGLCALGVLLGIALSSLIVMIFNKKISSLTGQIISVQN